MLKSLELSNIEEWKVLFLLYSVVYPHHLDQGLAKNIVFNKWERERPREREGKRREGEERKKETSMLEIDKVMF